jgi:hypothetical protein
MKSDIFIHNRKYVLNLERGSYYGGRTECFKIGQFTGDKYYYLDINSMYPAVMYDNFYPTKYFNYLTNCSITLLSIYIRKYCVVARVKVDTKEPYFPYRYLKKDHNSKYKSDSLFLSPVKELKDWVVGRG